ncbi:MAG TPA: hypothetical protein VGA41_04950 [Candidatus Dormibacteraeota bacterium]
MNEGPTGPQSEETPGTPPAETPAPGPASWEIPGQQHAAPTPAAAEVPPPDYGAPPGYAAPPAAAPPRPRNLLPVIAVGVIVVLIAAYAVAGYAVAGSRLDSARSTYNTVVSHQNAITDEFNSFDSKVTSVNISTATAADLKTNQTAYATLVSQSEAAGPTITADDASLASAQSSLGDTSWLTIIRKGDLDTVSAKIGYERSALASAKTITSDLVQLGTFYQSFYDSLIDLDTLGTKLQATDFTGAAAATTKLKTDVGKAIGLANAPGLPPEMKAFLNDFQSFAVDFEKFLNAVVNGDSNGAQAALNAVSADGTKMDGYDFDKMATAIKNFYQPLIDAFNAEVTKANNA